MLQQKTKHLLAAFIFILPLSPLLSHWLAVFALIAWFFEPNKNWRNLLTISSLLPFAWFLWHCISSLILHEPGANGANDVTLNLSFLLFPLLFATLDYSGADGIKIIRAFINGIFIAALYCFVLAVYHYYNSGDINVFFYESLVSPLDFHPTYFGYYLSFAFLINLYFVKTEWHIAPQISKILVVITQIFYFIFLILLTSRIVILGIFAVFAAWFLYEMQQRGKIIAAILGVISTFSLFLFIISQINFLKWRFAGIFSFLVSEDRRQIVHVDARTAVFEQTLQAIKANPLFGIGKNGVVDFIEKIPTPSGAILNNPHNQLLETQLALGIVGTAILIGMLIVLLKNAKFIQKNTSFAFITVIFVSLTSICSMTEALLERERGVLFFAFFYALLIGKLAFVPKNETAALEQ